MQINVLVANQLDALPMKWINKLEPYQAQINTQYIYTFALMTYFTKENKEGTRINLFLLLCCISWLTHKKSNDLL